MASDFDATSAFLDTCILFDFADGRSKNAKKIIQGSHSCELICSEFVRSEFENVMERREKMVAEARQVIAAQSTDCDNADLDVFEDLEQNDRDFALSLLSEMQEASSDAEALRRVRQKSNQLSRTYEMLFEDPSPMITVPPIPDRDAALHRDLQVYITNTSDLCVLCDCAAWTYTTGTGTFVTNDTGDFFNDEKENSDSNNDESEEEESLSASLDEFASDNRTLQEKLNDKIEHYYDESARVSIVKRDEFVKEI